MPSLRTGRPRQGGVTAMEPSSQTPPLISRTTEVLISRTAEVLYMLSRGAQLEHPHMINVDFAAHQPGPTLRDVKARLVALRGKGMPDSFSWSYKRKYRNTFIWCDLCEDDLILPLPGSDEYVLKAVKLFDVKVAASQDDKAVAVEHEELPFLTPRTSSPSPKPSSRHLASKPEHLHVENDVSVAIKKSLLLINIPPPADAPANLVMSNLKGGGPASDVFSLERGDVSSSRTVQDAPRTERTQTDVASQTEHVKELHKDVTTDCNFATSTKDETTSVSPQVSVRLHKDVTTECNFGTSKKDEPTSVSQTAHVRLHKDVNTECNIVTSKKDETTFVSQTAQVRSLHKNVTTECNFVTRKKDETTSISPRRKSWEKDVDKRSGICTHRDFTTDCNLGTSKKDKMTSVSPRRKSWEKNIDNSSGIHTNGDFNTDCNFGTSKKDETTFVSQTTPVRALHKDVTTECNLSTSRKDETTSVSPPRRLVSTPRVRRKSWEKDVDKSSGINEETSSNVGPDDPFLYGMLRKATKLGSSFRPRLCRGVDVVDATRTKTKLYYRSKAAKEESSAEPVPCEEESKSLHEFASLAEYFESKNLTRAAMRSPPPAVHDTRVNNSEEAAPPQTALGSQNPRRPFLDEALDASYRKTMEVLAKLPNSRGASRVHTHDHVPQRSFRSESKGNKLQEVIQSMQNCKFHDPHDDFVSRSCTIHAGTEDDDDDIPVPVVEARDRNSKPRSPVKQRSVMKKATMASFEASTVRAKAVKTPDERRIKAPRNNVIKVEDSTKLQRAEMDSRALHNGNKQGLKSMAPATNSSVEGAAPSAAPPADEEVVTSKIEGAKRWPLEPTARPRDFKSREDRPLIPGLTTTDWEKSLQEACMYSEPPANLVLHECLQCGRTFKPESLQVHMRGCRGGNKPKPVSRRRTSPPLQERAVTHY